MQGVQRGRPGDQLLARDPQRSGREKSTASTRPVRRGGRFRRLVEAVVDYAIYELDPSGQISTWNRGAERIKGYPPDEIIGKHFSLFYTPEDREKGVPARALQIAAERGRYEAEGWRIRKDGSRFWAMVVIDAIHNARGDVVGFAKVTRDITERHNAEVKLRSAQEQLASAQKMEAVGQLSGGIAHDFNNLMMIVMGNLESAQSHLRRGADVHALTRSINNAMRGAQRAAALTSRLLAFSRRQPLDPKVLDLTRFLDGTAEFLQRTLGEKVKVQINLQHELSPIEVDPNQLESALVNLAINARDAMPDGGTLRIEAKLISAEEASHLRVPSDDFVCITVADSGSGISPENLNRVFEPFFTTKEPGHGTGLGLSQVYGFVNQSGGRIHIESEVGQGTKVHMCFPKLRKRQRGSEILIEENLADGTLENESILLVEDNHDLREFIVDVLKQLGYRVYEAPDGDAALRFLQNAGSEIDLLITDVVMPGLNGRQLVQEVRRFRPALKVLYMTGYARDVLAQKDLNGSSIDMIHKPVSQNELAKRVRAILDG